MICIYAHDLVFFCFYILLLFIIIHKPFLLSMLFVVIIHLLFHLLLLFMSIPMSARKDECFWQPEVPGGDWRRFDSSKSKTGGIDGGGEKELLWMPLCCLWLILVQSSVSVHHVCRCQDELSCLLGIGQARGSQQA